MGTLKSGENRICPNCGTGFYVKPFIAKKPNRGKYCSNKCQKEWQKKLGIPNPGAFKSKPKFCKKCSKQLEDKGKTYCSEKCKTDNKKSINRKSKFTLHRIQLSEQGIKEFKWHGLCGICKKANKIYYVCNTSKTCKPCLTKRLKNKRSTIEGKKRWREQINKWRNKKRKEDPAFKIHTNMRTRISNMIKNIKTYRIGCIENMFGCNRNHLIKHIESKFTSKMSWDNYGAYWHIDHIIPISSFDLSDPAQCKAANHWTNLQPLEASKNMSKSNKIINPQPQLMLQC